MAWHLAVLGFHAECPRRWELTCQRLESSLQLALVNFRCLNIPTKKGPRLRPSQMLGTRSSPQ